MPEFIEYDFHDWRELQRNSGQHDLDFRLPIPEVINQEPQSLIRPMSNSRLINSRHETYFMHILHTQNIEEKIILDIPRLNIEEESISRYADLLGLLEYADRGRGRGGPPVELEEERRIDLEPYVPPETHNLFTREIQNIFRLGRTAVTAEAFYVTEPVIDQEMVAVHSLANFSDRMRPVADFNDPVALAKSVYLPTGWNPKRTGEIIIERLKAGIDPHVSTTARLLRQFECPEKVDGDPTCNYQDMLTVMVAPVLGEATDKLPRKESSLRTIFRSDKEVRAYRYLQENSDKAIVDLIVAEEIVSVPGLNICLADYHMSEYRISAKKQSAAIKNLKEVGRRRQAYNTEAQDWLRTHSTAPADLLIEAWENRVVALKNGVADNPRAIKKWSDKNKLTVDLANKEATGKLPEGFTLDMIDKHRPVVNELLAFYDGKRDAPSDPAEVIIETIMKHEQNFNPDRLIEPAKIKLADGWTGEILEKEDPRGYMIGYHTDCCMHPANVGYSCVEAGYGDPRYGFFALYDEDGVLAAHSLLYTNTENHPSVLVVDNIEIASGRNRDAIAQRYQEFFGTYSSTVSDESTRFTAVNMGVRIDEHYEDFHTRVPSVRTPLEGTHTDARVQVLLWEENRRASSGLSFLRIMPKDVELLTSLEKKIYPDLEGELDSEESTRDFHGPISTYNYFIYESEGDDPVGYMLATYGELTYEIDDSNIWVEDVLYVDDVALLQEHQGKMNGFMVFKKIMEIAERHHAPILFHAKDDTSWSIIKDRQKVFERYGYKFEVIKHEEDYHDENQGAHLVKVEKIDATAPVNALAVGF